MPRKDRIAALLVPLARLVIRHVPIENVRKAVWSRVFWRARSYVTTTKDGLVMAGTTVDLVQRYIYYFGEWEPNLTAFFKRYWQRYPHGTFIDIGSNVGYYALLAASYLKTGRSIAIEADPEIFALLVRNVNLNPTIKVEAINRAVMSGPGEIILYEGPPENRGQTTSDSKRFPEGRHKRVRADRLDTLVGADAISSCYCCKIDVEGAEYDVVKGLSGRLHEFPKEVVFTVEVNSTPAGSESTAAIFRVFRDAGFEAYEIVNEYSAHSYWTRAAPDEPKLLREIPGGPTDVIFFRPEFM